MRQQLAILLLVCSNCVLALGQEKQAPRDPCPGKHDEALIYLYASDLLQKLEPPGEAQILISLSGAGSNSKLALRISRPPTAFELWRGTPEEDIFAFLSRLQHSCLLPSNPYEAIRLVKVKWEKVTLTPEVFQREYHGFSSALTKYATNVEARPSAIRGGRVILHSTEYRVSYESFGFEQFDITQMDDSDGPNTVNPIVAWARGFEKFAEESFKGKASQSRRNRSPSNDIARD